MSSVNSPDYYLKKEREVYKKSVGMQRRTDFASARREIPVDEKTILYTSFHGRGMVCNPYALFKYIKSEERFNDYKHVWVLDNLENHQCEIEEYQDDENVIFVQFHSQEYMWYLASAKYLINNVTEQSYFVPKKEQIVINTWHGIPLKHLGYDTPDGIISSNNSIRNFLFADYILSPCKFMTDVVYGDSYKLKGAYEGKIIETGYPRCDLVLNSDRKNVIKKLQKYGVDIDPEKKIILYAPTWRGAKYANPKIDLTVEKNLMNTIEMLVDTSEYQVLFKPHQVVYKNLQEKGLLEPSFVPASVDPNELLSITDILISDYSSIFFDFLVTGRPILFFVPDMEEYANERGFYFKFENLPGPVSDKEEEIAKWIIDISKDSNKYWCLFDKEKYLEAQNLYTGKDDGNASKRVVDAIFNNDRSDLIEYKNEKIKLLFHLDIARVNGITSALINLFNNIDYEKYDVTLNLILPKDDASIIEKINKNVRALLRVGATISTLNETALKDFCNDRAIVDTDRTPFFPRKMYEDEFIRCFGRVKYDFIVNFSGYNGFWTNVLSLYKGGKKLIWLHNDLKAELEERIIDGKRIFEKNLPQVFKYYNYADKLVGCSKATMLINREKLGTELIYDKFTYMHNLLDINKIEEMLKDDSKVIYLDGREYWCNCENMGDIDDGKEVELIPLPEEKNINFINVARLSPEKNQENLIRAFAKVYKKVQRARLYILGEGPLKNHLLGVVKELNLVGKVIITGNVDNPFIFEKKSQCFVLPSYHEGFPMVLLEARTIGLPIIVSNFSTVEDCLFKDGQYLTEMGENDIYMALEAFIEGKVPNNYVFDAYEYNKMCIKEFDKIIEDSLEKKNEDKNL